MFPLVDHLGFSSSTGFVLAFALGIAFGFFLERGGFANAMKLAMQFYFRDLTVFKVMFTAIVTAMSGLVILSGVGLLDPTLVYINPTYLWPGVVGGLIMGAGFVIGGYCPGTAMVGVATAKLDAIAAVAGGMMGMFVFGEMFNFETISSFYALETPGITGRITLPDFLGVRPGVVAAVILLIAVAGFIASEWAERRYQASITP
jgi:uncharacterized protein